MKALIIYTLEPQELVQIISNLGKAKRNLEVKYIKEKLSEKSKKFSHNAFEEIDKALAVLSTNNKQP